VSHGIILTYFLKFGNTLSSEAKLPRERLTIDCLGKAALRPYFQSSKFDYN